MVALLARLVEDVDAVVGGTSTQVHANRDFISEEAAAVWVTSGTSGTRK